MSRVGVFAVSRDIFDHPIFAKEKFSEREAWIWLVAEAAWKPTRVKVADSIIHLDRGQCSFSLRFMAAKWLWSEAKVRRFIKRLKTDAMVTTDCDAGPTRITICKYKEYQRVSLPTDAPSDALTDAGPTQDRRKEEDREYIEDNKEEKKGNADAQDYAFVGSVIRLSHAGFKQWQNGFPHILDMKAELTKADAYYTENPPKDGKWFFPVSKWLERSNSAAKEAAKPKRFLDKNGNEPGSIYYNVDY